MKITLKIGKKTEFQSEVGGGEYASLDVGSYHIGIKIEKGKDKPTFIFREMYNMRARNCKEGIGHGCYSKLHYVECHGTMFSTLFGARKSINPNSKFVKAVFATILTLIFVTLLDIYVIVYLWLPSPTTSFGSELPWFWWIPLGFIEFFLPLAASWLLNNRLPLLNYLFFTLGVEDTLFYLIAYKGIPEIYHGIYYLGVFFAPPKFIVLAGNLLAVGLAVTLVHGFRRHL